MRRVVTTLVLALSLAGCGLSGRVPLAVAEDADPDHCCVLSFFVMDVVADPTYGTVDKATGRYLVWPRGYTARRAGSEIEVLDPAGKVVLTTGGRYWFSPLYPEQSVIGMVKPCPECELGGGPL